MSTRKRFQWPGLTIRAKLLLLVGVLAAVASAIGISLIIQQREDIRRARVEAAGVDYQREVQNLLASVIEHRSLSHRALSGGTDASQRLGELQGTIEGSINSLGALQRRGAQATETLETIERNWNVIVARSEAMNARQSFDAHSRLVEEIERHALAAGEGSGLRTTPELAAFHLADTVLERLGAAADDLGRLQTLAADRAQTPSSGASAQDSEVSAQSPLPAPEEADAELLVLIDAAGSDLEQITRSLELAFAQGVGLREGGEPVLQVAERQVARLLESARALQPAAVPADAPPAQRLFSEGERAVASIFSLSQFSLDSLDQLLDARLTALNRQSILVLAGLALALILGLVLAVLIVRGLTRQVDAIGETFSRIGIGDFGARVPVISRDELGALSINLNAMLDNTLDLIQTAEERDRIQVSIRKLLDEISGVAEGDLTAQAEVSAEVTGAIADSFNFMIEQLRDIIRQVQHTTGEVATSARTVAESTVRLADSSNRQSQLVVTASGRIDDMAGSIRQVSESAATAGVVAQQALRNAQEGNQAVADTIHGMGSIRQHVQETTKRMKRLGESSQEIGEIVQLMAEIADRTSMLALNASIQAAMAGEAGKGFAVVAEEIERLAERSTESSKRIEGLINGIQVETAEATLAMEKTTQEVVSGSGIANRAGHSLAEIESVSQRLSELVHGISVSSQDQAGKSGAVARSMKEVSTSILGVAQGTQEAAEAIRNLTDLAETLRGSVSTFRLPEMAGPRAVAASSGE